MQNRNEMAARFLDTSRARLATRLAFFAAGFAIASWAPLIPAIKMDLRLNEAQLGVVLLCLGLGSLLAMPLVGVFVARRGARRVILGAGVIASLTLPVLAMAPSGWALGAVLLVFGAALGSLDVAMNVHGAEIETIEDRPLISGFHAMFSIGALAGAAVAALFVATGFSTILTAASCGVSTLVLVLLAGPRSLNAKSGETVLVAWPRGIVIVLAVLVCVTFLVEGAILDWGALLLLERQLATPRTAGVGFLLFSIGMVFMRLVGDSVVMRAGRFTTLVTSGMVVMFGICAMLFFEIQTFVYIGYLLVGLGAANIAPILLSLASRQTAMPTALAVATVTIAGYGGHLMAPAVVGFVAQKTDLVFAFWILFGLAGTVPLGGILLQNSTR